MEINLSRNKERFEKTLQQATKREGIDNLLKWLDRSDFYVAPASTQYHLACEGGLCQHSLDVYDEMVRLADVYFPKNEQGIRAGLDEQSPKAFDDETIAVVALLHDICKADTYQKYMRNVKNERTGKWDAVESYRYNEHFIYGHGEKSVYIIQQFARLGMDEAQAIRFQEEPLRQIGQNSGFYDVWRQSPLATLLSLANIAAQFIKEA